MQKKLNIAATCRHLLQEVRSVVKWLRSSSERSAFFIFIN
jgi:hypothetical protein